MDTFDVIFKRWVETGNLHQSDIIPILLAYNEEFGTGKVTGEQVNALTQFLLSNPFMSGNLTHILTKALKNLGIRRQYQWAELYDANGRFMCRFWNPQDEKNEL